MTDQSNVIKPSNVAAAKLKVAIADRKGEEVPAWIRDLASRNLSVPGRLEPGPDDHFPGIAPELEPLVERQFERVEREVLQAIADAVRADPELRVTPTMALEGSRIFSHDSYAAMRWDSYSEQDRPWSLWKRAKAVAVNLAMHELGETTSGEEHQAAG